jgi:hypothetical protein
LAFGDRGRRLGGLRVVIRRGSPFARAGLAVGLAHCAALCVIGAVHAQAGPLSALEDLAPEASIDEVEMLMERAYREQTTPSERARALGAAASFASGVGEHAQALAWIDWSIEQAELVRGDSAPMLETAHADAISIALAADNPLQAREHARRYAELELAWADDPDRRAVRLDPYGVHCPDELADRFVRVRISQSVGAAGDQRARPTRCVYAPFASERALDQLEIELYAQRALAPAPRRIRGVVEAGLDPEDARVRAEIAERLPLLTTLVERDSGASDVGDVGYALYERRGVSEVRTIAYVVTQRDGALLAARVSANEYEWPPTRLREIANLALAAMAAE